MIFFNNHKKNGREAAAVLLDLVIKKSFTLTPYFDETNFIPPNNFYKDKYVRAYISNFIDLLSTFAFNGKSWSKTKRGEYMFEAFSTIDPSNILWKQLTEMSENIDEAIKLRNNKDYRQGLEDSTTFLGVTYNKLKHNDPDPILAEARKLAPQLEKQNASLGLGSGDHLPAAILMLTFVKYVKEKWKYDEYK